jgi:uncharacterized tellurite resistance protein B-like protein
MFDSLKHFIAELGGGEVAEREFRDDDYRLAAVALLVHVANVDGSIDAAERQRLKTVIADRFDLDAAATTRLIAAGERSDRESVDFFHFTNILKRSLDDAGRHRVIEMMWEIAFADGDAHEFEENVVSRVAELLGVSPRDRVLLKQRAAAEPAEEVPPGPWARPVPEGKA